MFNKKYLFFGLVMFLGLIFFVSANTNVVDLASDLKDYYMEVSRGNVKGQSHINKFGANYDTGTSYETLWDYGGDYNWLENPVYLQISSSDVDDTTGDTGARTVIVKGLDENWEEYSETVTLNGQSTVNTTGQFIRVFRMLIDESGSTQTNEGNIYASTGGVAGSGVPSDATQVYAQITAGNGQTLMALYTIPANKEAYLLKGFATSDGTKNVNIQYFNRPFNRSKNVKFDFDMKTTSFIYEFGVPSGAIPEKTDLWVQAKVDVGSSKISGGFDLILIANT